MTPPAADTSTSEGLGALLQGRGTLALCVLAGALAIAGSGMVGYQRQQAEWSRQHRVAASTGSASQAAASAPALRVVQAQASASAASAPAWPMWEFQLRQPIPPRDPPLTPPPWRMIGASNTGGSWQLIVLRQGQVKPDFLKTGDSLPGGFRIVEITQEDVTLARGKNRVILSYIGSR